MNRITLVFLLLCVVVTFNLIFYFEPNLVNSFGWISAVKSYDSIASGTVLIMNLRYKQCSTDCLLFRHEDISSRSIPKNSGSLHSAYGR